LIDKILILYYFLTQHIYSLLHFKHDRCSDGNIRDHWCGGQS